MSTSAFDAELAALVVQLQEIEGRIHALTGGQVDAVLDTAGRTHLLEQAQRRLLASEDEQRQTAGVQTSVLNALPAHVALLNAHGRIVSVNEPWKRFGAANGWPDPLFGVGTDYAGVCDRADGLDATEAVAAAQGVRAVLAGDKRAFALEYPCHAPGQQRWYRMTVTPVDDTRAAGVVVMHMDISQRVLAEHALRDSEQRFRGIVEVLPDLVLTVVDGAIGFINEAGMRLLRATQPSQVLGRSPLDIFVAPGPLTLRQHLLGPAGAVEGGGFAEAQLLALDGSEVEVDAALSSYESEGRRVVQLVCRDLSERKRAERRQKQLADRLTGTLEKLSDAFCTVDREWRFTYVNAAAEALLARGRAELLGQVAWTFFPGAADTAIGQALHRAMAQQQAVQLVEQLAPHDIWIDLRLYGSAQGLAVYARDVSRERRLAAQLEEERSRLLQAQAVAHMGSWQHDMASGKGVWSAEACRIFEVDPVSFEPTYESFLALVHPEDRAGIDAAFQASIGGQVPTSFEHRVLLPDGRVKAIEERWQVFCSPDGTPVRAVGTCQDISERKQAEQLLRRSQAMVQLAGRMARLGGWSVELPSMAVHWSDEVAAIHDEPPGTAPKIDDAINYYAPEHRDIVSAHVSRCVEQGTPFDLELQIITARGHRRWVRAIGQPDRDDSGRIVRVQGAFQEISERKLAEQATQELAHRLQTTLESITDGLYTLDADWCFNYLNSQAERLLGRSRDALLGQTVWQAFPETLGSPLQLNYERALRQQVAVAFEFEYPPLAKWFEVNAYPSGQGLAVYFRDISERKRDQDALRELNAQLEARVEQRTAELSRAREEAEQASLAKSAFLATMSHEIRTPMNGVIGMVDVLHQTSLRGYQVEMVDLIRESAHSLLGIIEDILDFSKIEAGRMDIERHPLNLADMVEAVCGMLDHSAVKRDVRMAIHVDPAIPSLLVGDEARLRQVLVNLVGNAIKFCGGREQPGRVAVRARLQASDAASATVELSVVDNGIGMDEATMARLFRPFAQGDASTTRRFGGTGLGLAISSTLVKLMGGEISVRSAPGQGAAFTVVLTLARAAGEAPSDPAAALVRGLRCCLIGDDRPLAADIAAYLRHAGVDVERATTPAVAAAAPVWIVLPSLAQTSIETLRALASQAGGGQALFFRLGSGYRRRPRMEAPDLLVLDHCGLTRQTLCRVLARLSGRLATEALDAADGEGQGASGTDARVVAEGRLPEGRQILVAEDNETNRKVLREQLRLAGFDAEFAEDGQQALELWRSGDFGLLLTDLHMPRMDGYALASTIRAEEQSRNARRTAIVALTANALRDEEQRCRSLGMDDYLSKPVRLARLRAAIERWLPDADDPAAPDEGLLQTRPGAAMAEGRMDEQVHGPVNGRADGSGNGIGHGIGHGNGKGRDGAHAQAWVDGPDPRPLVDLAVLKALIGSDEAVIADVLRAFRSSARTSHSELTEAALAGHWNGVADAAHKLKSGARSIGALKLGERCQSLEAAAATGQQPVVAAQLQLFEAELRDVMAWLDHR